MNEDQNQNKLIDFLKDRLDSIDAKLEHCSTKRDLDRIIESYNRRIGGLAEDDKKARIDIDAHCIRIRELERQKAVQEVELAPIKRLYDNFTSAMIGLFILLGAIFIGALYWIKGRL